MRPVFNKKRRKNRVQRPAQHLLPWSEHCRHKSCKIRLHKEDPAMLQGSYHFLSQIYLSVHPLHTIKKTKQNNTRYVISILNCCCCWYCTPPSTHVVRNVKTLLRVLKRQIFQSLYSQKNSPSIEKWIRNTAPWKDKSRDWSFAHEGSSLSTRSSLSATDCGTLSMKCSSISFLQFANTNFTAQSLPAVVNEKKCCFAARIPLLGF
jgi:hypothetical protein